MNNLTINNNNISIKFWKSQPVVTFKDIDLLHERPDGTARKRFAENREHFIENEDYFFAKPENTEMSEKRTFKIPPRGLILLTESGYLLLAKSLTDDKAWKVQRQLVNCYFKVKEDIQPQQMKLPETKCEYKIYNGATVLTIDDISKISLVNRVTIYSIMKANNFTYGIEYEQLTGKQLLMFKNQNKSVSTYVSNIIIVYRGGLEKLEKALKCSFNLPKEISDIDESTLKELKTAALDYLLFYFNQLTLKGQGKALERLKELTRYNEYTIPQKILVK